MKAKTSKKNSLRHSSLADEMEKPAGKLKLSNKSSRRDDDNEDLDEDEVAVPAKMSSKISKQAFEQLAEVNNEESTFNHDQNIEDDSDKEFSDEDDEDDDELNSEFVEKCGEYVDSGLDLSAEEAVVQKFLTAGRSESRSLADIIMDKLRAREENAEEADAGDDGMANNIQIPPKVIEVYTSVGKMLQHYKSGKLPKALKMLPHLKNWEHILWLTRPDEWSPSATYAATRIFASNLNAKMAQRFFNLVLLEKCRDDIRINNKMNFHLYLALKKALFKPAAFYKGLLLPLAQSQTCTLREALIIGSVLAKVSIPGNHSAAVILRLAEMPYSGSTSLFIKILLSKKYALPRRVIDALVTHFCSFSAEHRVLPVIWHQSFLVFAQRYKLELNDLQREKIRLLLRSQQHHQITSEIRREIFQSANSAGDDNDM